MAPTSSPQRPLLALVFVAIAAWGAYHVAGALWYTQSGPKAMVVLASFVFFLGCWLLLLTMRARKPTQSGETGGESAEAD